MSDELPIDRVLPELRKALAHARQIVIEAPPGAGKTTRVPLDMLDAPWLGRQRILMLEPRRVAARAAARFMAATLGEKPGETVGFRMRHERRSGPRTRLEIITEGLLARALQADPELTGVGAVIFDEFHERSLAGDLGLALSLDTQRQLRPDLRIIIMSATLDTAAIERTLPQAVVVTTEGRSYPVTTHYLPPRRDERLAVTVSRATLQITDRTDGDVLVFLPGVAEIERSREALERRFPDFLVAPLHARLSDAAQSRALLLAGRRKIVLATTIAQTSLTIEGVTGVIDSGLTRQPQFDPASALTRLVTRRVSRAAADQRRGRAGRLAPGLCYRLWSEGQQRGLIAHDRPEILAADLAPLVLELAVWGADPDDLVWLDPPPDGALAQAHDLLRSLQAIDARGLPTPRGRDIVALGTHPRLAAMLLHGRDHGGARLACDIAALLEEPDLLTGAHREADLGLRLELLAGNTGGTARRVARVRKSAARWRQLLDAKSSDDTIEAGALLTVAYPERIAQQRGSDPYSYLMASGRGARLADGDRLHGQPYLAVAEVTGADDLIRLAAAVTLATIETLHGARLESEAAVAWAPREQAVRAEKRVRLGALVLDVRRLDDPDPEQLGAALLAGIRAAGPPCLPLSDDLERFRTRVEFLRRAGVGEGWPDLSDEGLMDDLESWLAPYLVGVTRLSHLAKVDVAGALRARLDWAKTKELEQFAPARIAAPSGASHTINYSVRPEQGETPILAVPIQEMFGATTTPTIARGQISLTLHLLSPARRPLQITRDLTSFWQSSYTEVRKEMKGRYPKHYWPDDPLTAAPRRGTRRR